MGDQVVASGLDETNVCRSEFDSQALGIEVGKLSGIRCGSDLQQALAQGGFDSFEVVFINVPTSESSSIQDAASPFSLFTSEKVSTSCTNMLITISELTFSRRLSSNLP